MESREEYENLILITSSNILHTTVIRSGFVLIESSNSIDDLIEENALIVSG